MIRLSNLADYAVVAMAALAESGERLSASALAEKSGIPAPTAAKLTQHLARAGLVQTVRGVGGGVVLGRAAEEVTLVEIVEAVDGPIGLTQCLHENAADCAVGTACNVRPHWALINAKVRGALAGVTLADLTKTKEPA